MTSKTKVLRTAFIYALLSSGGFVLANTLMVSYIMEKPEDAFNLYEALIAGVFSFVTSFVFFCALLSVFTWLEQRAKNRM